MNARILPALCFALLFPFLTLGQEPASVSWKQIKTGRFQVIYPEGYDSAAMRCASMLNTAYDYVTFSMKRAPRPVSIILHNQNSTSNGMVALSPKRAEFWQTPMQETLHPFDWTGGLVLHEFRHVVQFDMLNQGCGRLLFILFGENGLAFKSIFSPDWFYEGDAVATETALSPAGRGRSADFNKLLKAQVLEKKIYSYSKAALGSYKDYVPNQYCLGYNLITYGRAKWGARLWENAHTSAAYGGYFMLRPFSNAMKTQTGMNKEAFYRSALSSLQAYWGSQSRKYLPMEYDDVKIEEKNTWTNYCYPHYIGDNEIVALKSGMSHIPTIVMISPGGAEQVLAEVPTLTSGCPISTNGSCIVWSEETPHVRWTEKSYSDVFMYDIAAGRRRQLTRGTHYYAPDISPGGKVIAVEATRQSTYNIVILDSRDGVLLETIHAPGTDFVLTPRWAADGRTAVCVLLNDKGKRIASVDTETGTFTDLCPPSFTDVSNPFFYDKYLVYTSELNGENEVYALDTMTRLLFQVTGNTYGARYPSVYKDKLLFSYYTADGYAVGQQQFKPAYWYTADKIIYRQDTLVNALLKDEKGVPAIFEKTRLDSSYTQGKYNKFSHMVNIHSWGVVASSSGYDSENSEATYGVMSQDKLGTMTLNLGYKSDDLGSSKFFTELYYKGLFPVFQFNFETGYHGYQPSGVSDREQGTDPYYFYERTVFSQTISIPLNLSKGSFYRSVSLSVGNQYQKLGDVFCKYYTEGESSSGSWSKQKIGSYDGSLDYLNYQLTARCIKYYPVKNILPRLGISVTGGFAHGLPGVPDDFFTVASKVYAKADAYLPGLFLHHTVHVMGGHAYTQETGSIEPSHPVPFARGYLGQSTSGDEITSARVDYTFTLWNPDLPVGSLLYVKRIYPTLFYDLTVKNLHQFESKGFELRFETHVLTISTPLVVGFRQSFIEDGSAFEFFFGISE